MSYTTTHKLPQAAFYNLSQDLEALIFEFLPLSDYPSLQLVSSRFNDTLRHCSRLWARHVFLKFLKPNRPLDDFLDEEFQDQLALINEDQILFDKMETSKAMIQSHYTTRLGLNTSLNHVLSPEATQSYTKKIMKILEIPVYPCPMLKRDIHFFPTKTLFQNFLTEVFFGIQDRCLPGDKKQALTRNLIEKMRNSRSLDTITEKDLLLLRRCPLARVRSSTVAVTVDSDDERSSRERGTVESTNVPEQNDMKPVNFVENFSNSIYELIQNRCDMISTCLGAISTQEGLLSEYCRLWSEFVLTILEMSRTLVPFSKFVNGLFKKVCDSADNTPEFSVWRFMVKIWKNTIFNPLSKRLLNAFTSVLLLARQENNLGKEDKALDPAEAVSRQFAEDSDVDAKIEDEKLQLLKAFHNALGDLSYDETTVFYWKCLATIKETPKAELDDKIIEEIMKHYRVNQPVWIKKPQELLQLFKEDQKMVETVFDRELAHRMKESQLEYVRGFLTEHLVAMCDSASPQSSQPISAKTLNTSGFEHLFKVLNVEELIKGKIDSDEKLREGFFEALEQEQKRLFRPLLTNCDKLKDEIALLYEENHEMYLDLVQRGLGQANSEEEATTLFIITSNSFNEHYVAKQW